ncbi:MAG: hypothetical protein H6684_07450 [Deltaproteobacteria bacterium]|nr:hypothetical protein [bacterium]MCB9475885.1 hypothetical protein [Deltaproteobacteria bacterium]MCB9488547.1 hypothetical protein [Deltaproteobacteria bacterium]
MADDRRKFDDESTRATDADLRGLSTFQFALVVIAGLAVFTLVVAGLSTFRRSASLGDLGDLSIDEQTVRERGGEFFEPDITGEPARVAPADRPRPTPLPHRAAPEEPGLADKVVNTLLPDPNRYIYSDKNSSPYYGKDGAPVVPVRIRRDDPRMAGFKEKIKSIIGRIFRYIQAPEKAAKQVRAASSTYLGALGEAMRYIQRTEDGRVLVTYRQDLDQRMIVAEAGYRRAIESMMDIYLEGIEGTPNCVGTMPKPEALNDMRLPTFDPKQQGGEDAQGPDYILGSQAADPFATAGRIRDHVAQVLDCVGQAKDPIGVQIVEGNREVYRQETQPIPIPDAEPGEKTSMLPGTESVTPGIEPEATPKPTPAVYGALKPGEDVVTKPTPTPKPGETPAPAPTPTPEPAGAVRPEAPPPGVYGALKPGEDPRATPTPIPEATPPTPTPFPTPEPGALPEGVYGPLNPGETP